MSSNIGLPGAAASNPPPPSAEDLRCGLAGAEAWIGARRLGIGSLHVAESRLAWLGDGEAANFSFSLNYPAISLHGLAKSGGPVVANDASRPHLYLLVRGDLLGDGNEEANGANSEDPDGDNGDFQDDDEDSETNTEVRFYPPLNAPENALMAVFQAVSDCQALHPDAEDADSDEDQDDADDDAGDDDVGYDENDEFDQEIDNNPTVGMPNNGGGDQQQPMDTDEQFEDA